MAHQYVRIAYFFQHPLTIYRDRTIPNIMMDGRPPYPHGHHPFRSTFAVGNVVVFPATQVSRLDASVRYYFTKFNILAEFEEAENVTRAALGPLRPR